MTRVARHYLGDNYENVDLVGDESVKSSETIEHLCLNYSGHMKPKVLANLVRMYSNGGRTIIFVQTKAEASDLSAHPDLSGCKRTAIAAR